MPLTLWIKQRLGCLISILTPYVFLKLTTPTQLQQNAQGSWVSTGGDPSWRLKPLLGINPCGWYVLTLKIRTAATLRLNARLYVDYGDGYHEEASSMIPLKSGVSRQRILWFHKPVAGLRLDPMGHKEIFELETLHLIKIPAFAGKHYLLKRLRKGHPTLKRLPFRKTLSYYDGHKRQKLKSAYDAFNQTFQLHNTASDAKLYSDWIRLNESKNPTDTTARLAALTYQPIFSIVTPTWNTERSLLRKCIESVLHQQYPHWELCIADDASTEPHVVELLKEYANGDERIKYQIRKTNGHISAASNTGLSMATGDYVTFLDHDDELAPNALLEVACEINKNRDLQIIYSDEDFIDDAENRSSPHFKSDWNPALLLSHNYITHLCVYRRALIEKIGGFRTAVEGAQDYDLILRCSSLVPPTAIAHIPKILYHWRATEGSTALSADHKSYTVEAGRRALADYLDAKDITAEVIPAEQDNFYRIKYTLPEKPLVSLIIPTRDAADLLRTCISSILDRTSYDNYEIVIVDNQSREPKTDDYFEELQTEDRITILSYDKPFNYSAINNFAAQSADGDIIGLINNDIEVINEGWLDEMVMLAMQPDYGCIGAKLYYPDNTIQHGGVIIGLGGHAAHSHRGLSPASPGYFNRLNVRQNLSAVTGACLLIRRQIYEEVNGLDEGLVVAYNDVDFCLRVKEAGYLNVFTPFAELYHHESKTRGMEDTPEKIARFDAEKAFLKKRWGKVLDSDPYYNPNLTHSREDFSLRC